MEEMKFKLRTNYFKQKPWYCNMNDIVLNYLHCSEDNLVRWIHMNHRCRLDRLGGVCKCFREV